MTMPAPHPSRPASSRALLRFALAVPLLALGLAGCADRPPAASFLAMPQKRIGSAAHWQTIANDVASAVSAHLMAEAGQNQPGMAALAPAVGPAVTPASGLAPVPAVAQPKSFFERRVATPRGGLPRGEPSVAGGAANAAVEPPPVPRPAVMVYMMRNEDTPFADGFIQALTTAFVQLGHAVSMDSRPDVVAVGIDVSLLKHEQSRPNRTFPGPLTALGAGVTVANWLKDPFPWGVTALGLGLDAARATVSETDTELLLSVSLAKDGFYTFRSSAVYYVADAEAWHYQSLGDPRMVRSLNDLPESAISYDIAGKPYVNTRSPGRR
ncbi:MAG TPA: hypothetical protein VED40_22360 [Azospirillaceae bacterium]|nr:hypothetical protein [Azospirillaceae bacterium]